MTHGTPGPSASRSPISVLIAVEVRLYREGLAASLAEVPGLTIVATAAAADPARNAIRELEPQVVLLDLGKEDGAALVRECRESACGVQFIALGVREVEPEVLACAEMGYAGYVPRHDSLTDLVAAIQAAAKGELQCSPRIAASLFRRVATLTRERPRAAAPASLTARENEIARLLALGLSNKQIALRLHIRISTVKSHVHRILAKLDLPRRGAAAARVLGSLGAR